MALHTADETLRRTHVGIAVPSQEIVLDGSLVEPPSVRAISLVVTEAPVEGGLFSAHLAQMLAHAGIATLTLPLLTYEEAGYSLTGRHRSQGASTLATRIVYAADYLRSWVSYPVPRMGCVALPGCDSAAALAALRDPSIQAVVTIDPTCHHTDRVRLGDAAGVVTIPMAAAATEAAGWLQAALTGSRAWAA